MISVMPAMKAAIEMSILVTGATGVVGGAVAHQLAEHGQDVRGGHAASGPAGLPEGVEVVVGDMTVADDVDRALAGVQRAFLNMADDNGAAFVVGAARAGL